MNQMIVSEPAKITLNGYQFSFRPGDSISVLDKDEVIKENQENEEIENLKQTVSDFWDIKEIIDTNNAKIKDLETKKAQTQDEGDKQKIQTKIDEVVSELTKAQEIVMWAQSNVDSSKLEKLIAKNQGEINTYEVLLDSEKLTDEQVAKIQNELLGLKKENAGAEKLKDLIDSDKIEYSPSRARALGKSLKQDVQISKEKAARQLANANKQSEKLNDDLEKATESFEEFKDQNSISVEDGVYKFIDPEDGTVKEFDETTAPELYNNFQEHHENMEEIKTNIDEVEIFKNELQKEIEDIEEKEDMPEDRDDPDQEEMERYEGYTDNVITGQELQTMPTQKGEKWDDSLEDQQLADEISRRCIDNGFAVIDMTYSEIAAKLSA